jgi:hypothetical protein
MGGVFCTLVMGMMAEILLMVLVPVLLTMLERLIWVLVVDGDGDDDYPGMNEAAPGSSQEAPDSSQGSGSGSHNGSGSDNASGSGSGSNNGSGSGKDSTTSS